MARSGAANEAGARGGATRTSFLNTSGWKMAFDGKSLSFYSFSMKLPPARSSPAALTELLTMAMNE